MMAKKKPGFVKTKYDELTYKINGLAMQVHNELKPGHREKFYKIRLAELCRANGLEVNPEQRVEAWVGDMLVGYMFLDLWIENQLVVECKAFSHQLTNDEVYQAVAYLAATGTEVGMLYNFGLSRLDYHRIFPPSQIQDWQKSLYRAIWVKPGMSLPPLDTEETVSPIRFVVQGTDRTIEVPIRISAENPLSSSVHPFESVEKSVDYASSGVSIDAGNRAIELMKESVRATYNESVLAGIGSFGGLFDASTLKQMDTPVLVASTDGVGTKVKLSASVGRYRGIGHDIVNHCINDILVQGARPLFFMDYFATSKLNPEQTAEVVTGIAEACKESGMALLGGETAEMPDVYCHGEFDVAGTIIGIVEKDRILPRPNLLAGDLILGLPSSGPHTNGYSLIRKVFEGADLQSVHPELGCSLADALLAPHRSYFNDLYSFLPHIKALAHITGGGFIENIPRVLPENLSAVIHQGSWQIPPPWNLIQQKGNIFTEEMYRVFNMGIGMIAIVDKSIAAELQSSIPEPTFIIGELVQGERKVILTNIR
ncbi:MAG: phosphoribosylformylglycinamidine cyclo-ligase [Anaerolineales bacterium]|nr:phosphoribosylformylglycinamidine cyclo-ligase [Anaerolineales bacterium]